MGQAACEVSPGKRKETPVQAGSAPAELPALDKTLDAAIREVICFVEGGRTGC